MVSTKGRDKYLKHLIGEDLFIYTGIFLINY